MVVFFYIDFIFNAKYNVAFIEFVGFSRHKKPQKIQNFGTNKFDLKTATTKKSKIK